MKHPMDKIYYHASVCYGQNYHVSATMGIGMGSEVIATTIPKKPQGLPSMKQAMEFCKELVKIQGIA